jgi:signal transduction histidine kinase
LKEKYLEGLNLIRLKTLYADVSVSVLTGTIVAIVFAYVSYSLVSNTIIFTWLTLMILGGLVRITLRIKFMKCSESEAYIDTKFWLNGFHYSSSFVALLWGTFPLFLINQVPPEKDVIITVLILGLAAGGTISNLANRSTAYLYGMNIVVFYALKVMIEGKENAMAFTLCLVFFAWLLFKMTRSFSALFEKSTLRALELKDKIDLEQELQQEKLKSLQSSKLASLGEMAAGIAHEINNPLTISIGKLEILKRYINADKYDQEKFLSITNSVTESNRRVADIVQSMRNLSRMQDDVELQELKLSDVVNGLKPLIDSRLKKNNVELIHDFDDITVLADMSELSQVIMNLISNAIDGIKHNKGDLRIKVITGEDQGHYLVKVVDSGNGIQGVDVNKLFEPFFTTKEVGEGTGLGLSLSRSIMERIGGTLEYDSTDENTCFVLKIKKK